MTVDYKGRRYYLSFRHYPLKHGSVLTEARLETRTGPRALVDQRILLVRGAAQLHAGDLASGLVAPGEVKERGRRLALDRMLKGTTPLRVRHRLTHFDDTRPVAEQLPDREFRTAVWTTYHQRGTQEVARDARHTPEGAAAPVG